MASLTAGMNHKEISKPIRIAIATLGCKVNQCESAGIAEELSLHGMTRVPFEEAADCYIINTCTVTCRTDYQSRQLIRRATRRNPAAAVLVTGCYAQRAPEEIARIPGVRFVVGNAEKDRIPDILREMASVDAQTQVGEIRKELKISRLKATVFPDHTRTFLKIQDGCDAFCSYCIIPHVRGKCRSLPRAEVEEQITALVLNGYREVVLTGIHLGAWGCDLRPKTNLASLVQQIIQGRTVERLRLSSVEPREVSGTLISLLGCSHTICRHLHIPLQSGNDGILSAMRRNYNAAFFCDLLRRIDKAVPGIAVGIDVMAGFPGETERAFSDTLRLIEESPIAYLHVFPYSRRPGTSAATMSGQVPEEVKKRRADQLRAVGEKKRRRFAERFIGSPLNVLVERRTDPVTGFPIGFSDNYIPVAIRGNATTNTIVRAVPFRYLENRLMADVISE